MFGDFIIKLVIAVAKMLVLAALVVLAVVFIPDDFMANVDRQADKAGDFARGQFAERAPGVSQEFSRKVAETKEDALSAYQLFKEKYSSAIGSWMSRQVSNFWPQKK